MPTQELEAALMALTASGHEVIIFQVLDAAEITFKFERVSQFEDMESGRTLFVDPAAARREYLDRLESHCAALVLLCQRLGMGYQRLSTERPLELALFDFLRTRSEKRVRFSRQHAAGTGGK